MRESICDRLPVSLSVDCWYTIAEPLNETSVGKTTSTECRFAQIAGLVLLCVALGSFFINVHILRTKKKNPPVLSYDRKLIIGMFISSLCMIIISTPSVLAQCFLCRRLCFPLICSIEGFNSFFHGCTTMYILVVLSLIRYATTASSSMSVNFKRKLHEHNFLFVLVCFLLGGVWAVPPTLGYVSAYVPEGLGFHCGLDWFDRSFISRIYFFLLFMCVYFIPLAVIIYVNVNIQRTISRLTQLYPTVMLELNEKSYQELLRRHISNALCEKTVQRMRHLYEDRRFVIATGISVVIYLIAWTPYSVMALSQLFGGGFGLYRPWLMTLCALLAKVSMIINPIIYTSLLNWEETNDIILNAGHSF